MQISRQAPLRRNHRAASLFSSSWGSLAPAEQAGKELAGGDNVGRRQASRVPLTQVPSRPAPLTNLDQAAQARPTAVPPLQGEAQA